MGLSEDPGNCGWNSFTDITHGILKGSASLIAVDVQSLVDYIAKHVDPDHNPLEGLVKRKLLDKWATLQKHGKQADMLILFIPFALLVSF